MYKNFNCDLLGITGRQSEIIELALTYGFQGIDIEIVDLAKRCERTSFESASRFLTSCNLRIGGFDVPVDLDGDDASFEQQCTELEKIAEIASRANAQVGIVSVPSETDRLPYPEFFEVIRTRVNRIAEVFAKEDVKIALAFQLLSSGEAKQFKFIQDAQGAIALLGSIPNAGFVFDSWPWFCSGGSVELFEQIAPERVFAVRVSDCVQSVSPGSTTEDDCLIPNSTGVIDCIPYLQRLVTAGVDVAVSARGRQLDSQTKRDAFIAKTQESLNAVFVSAGVPGATPIEEPSEDSAEEEASLAADG